MARDITVIYRDIADGERFSHEGSLELHGNVGKGAIVNIDKGGLLIKGTVADGARLTVKGRGASTSISSGDLVGGRIIINGKVVSGNHSVGLSGITIQKQTGSNVMLETDGAIKLADRAGDGLHADAGGSISLNDVGKGLEAESQGSFKAGKIAAGARIAAGGSAEIDELGQQSRLKSGGSAKIGKMGAEALVKSGGSASIGSMDADSSVQAGGSARIDVAHATASIEAGGSKKIGRRSDNAADFSLSALFSAATDTASRPSPQAQSAPPKQKKRWFNL